MEHKGAQKSWQSLRRLMVQEQEASSPILRKTNRCLSRSALAKRGTQGRAPSSEGSILEVKEG